MPNVNGFGCQLLFDAWVPHTGSDWACLWVFAGILVALLAWLHRLSVSALYLG
jgi:hypothetical protein